MRKRRRRSENEEEAKAGRTKEHEEFRTLKNYEERAPLLVAQTTTRDRYYQGLRDFSPEASVISARWAPFILTQEFLVMDKHRCSRWAHARIRSSDIHQICSTSYAKNCCTVSVCARIAIIQSRILAKTSTRRCRTRSTNGGRHFQQLRTSRMSAESRMDLHARRDFHLSIYDHGLTPQHLGRSGRRFSADSQGRRPGTAAREVFTALIFGFG